MIRSLIGMAVELIPCGLAGVLVMVVRKIEIWGDVIWLEKLLKMS